LGRSRHRQPAFVGERGDPSEAGVPSARVVPAFDPVFGRANERRVWDGLTDLATKSHVLFPPEVCAELELGAAANPDPPLEWARRHRGCSERKASFEVVREVLTIAPELVDPDSPHEQADPYVVALALELKRGGFDVRVITDDRKDKRTRPIKLSVVTAAGLLGIATVPLFAFLRIEGLEPE
jgi:hypothetical protein